MGTEPAWIEVWRCPTLPEAEQHALVLVAVGISARLEPRNGGIGLLVVSDDATRARRELAAYDWENDRSYRPLQPARAFREGLSGAMIFCVALVFVHAAASWQAFSLDWLSVGEAQAGLIVGGEWWRVLTALGLHANAGHLLANLAMGSLLGLFLAQILGTGLAWLAILLAAGVGNFLNALAHPATYTSIGASTAVFAALGIIAVLTLSRQRSPWTSGLRRWLPLVGGVTLLALIGVGGERTDIGAHFAGFFVGCLFGGGLSGAGRRLPQGKKAQYAYGAAAIALFILAWLMAFEGAVAPDPMNLP